MGVGAVLLAAGSGNRGPPEFGPTDWLIVTWLAVANTALAFWLWNRTLRRLTAVESGVVNNTMLVQVSVLAWAFLGEDLSLTEVFGLVLAALGTLLVQLRTPPRADGAARKERPGSPEGGDEGPPR